MLFIVRYSVEYWPVIKIFVFDYEMLLNYTSLDSLIFKNTVKLTQPTYFPLHK